MRKQGFILVIIAIGILLSFSFVNAEELKVFPGEVSRNNSAGYHVQFCGFVGNSATFKDNKLYASKLSFFTVKKLPKQIKIFGKIFWILEANTDEDWILISDQEPKK